MRIFLMILAGSSIASLSTLLSLAQPAIPADVPAYVEGEVLVQFNPAATDAQLLDAVERGGLNLQRLIHTPPMRANGKPGLNVARIGRPVPDVIRTLQGHPAIEFVEPNWIYYPSTLPNDPDLGNLWGLGSGFGCEATAAWAAGFTGNDQVVVGIIDTGVDVYHPDLADNVWQNPFDAADGLDNDGNGFVDDLYGWDFEKDNNTVYDGRQDDHGTHVGGTIGAVGNNGIGVVGVNWNVKLITAKFLGRRGGSTADAIAAVDYLVDLKTRHGVNLVAINASWGGGGFSQGLLEALERAADANILFVAAAGNGDFFGFPINNDLNPHYPSSYQAFDNSATYDAVIAVTAIDANGNKASWANYGATSVDLGAPGVGILSTLPDNSYGSYSGTSMATPHVTGAAALYKAANPTATAAQIRSALLSAGKATPSLAGITVTGDRLDLSTMTGTPSPTPENQAPWADSQEVTVGVGQTISIVLTGGDPEGDPVTFLVNDTTSLGTLDASAVPNLTYFAGTVAGTDSFTFTTFDGELASTPATVTIQVTDAGAAPLAMSAQLVNLVEEWRGRNLKGTAVVQVADGSGTAVPDATVTGQWWYGGTDLGTSSAVTDATGQATFVVTVKASDPGLSFSIVDVVKDGYIYER